MSRQFAPFQPPPDFFNSIGGEADLLDTGGQLNGKRSLVASKGRRPPHDLIATGAVQSSLGPEERSTQRIFW